MCCNCNNEIDLSEGIGTINVKDKISKREYFAVMALQGYLGKGNSLEYSIEMAVSASDKLIKALEK